MSLRNCLPPRRHVDAAHARHAATPRAFIFASHVTMLSCLFSWDIKCRCLSVAAFFFHSSSLLLRHNWAHALISSCHTYQIHATLFACLYHIIYAMRDRDLLSSSLPLPSFRHFSCPVTFFLIRDIRIEGGRKATSWDIVAGDRCLRRSVSHL